MTRVELMSSIHCMLEDADKMQEAADAVFNSYNNLSDEQRQEINDIAMADYICDDAKVEYILRIVNQ